MMMNQVRSLGVQWSQKLLGYEQGSGIVEEIMVEENLDNIKFILVIIRLLM